MHRFLLLLLPLFVNSQEMLTRTQALMGTYVSITLPKQHIRQISESFEKLKVIELALSSYDANAALYQLNLNHSINYNDKLATALRVSKALYYETEGYFDVTIGSISKKLYRFGEEHSIIPSQKALSRAVLNIEAVNIGKETISTQKNITLDLGGMGKGFGVDHVASYLQEHNITHGIIALSGDIRCLNLCEFGLQSPFKETPFALLRSLVPQLSISTSGTYRRYVRSQEHHHLIDPKRAMQGKAFISVSLFTKANNTKIDVYATAISVMPKEKAFSFLKRHKEIGYIMMTRDGSVVYGNLEGLVSLEWLEKSEYNTKSSTNIKSKTNAVIKNNLIHPDVNIPDEIHK
jgi:FAD:protein FMN transferase